MSSSQSHRQCDPTKVSWPRFRSSPTANQGDPGTPQCGTAPSLRVQFNRLCLADMSSLSCLDAKTCGAWFCILTPENGQVAMDKHSSMATR